MISTGGKAPLDVGTSSLAWIATSDNSDGFFLFLAFVALVFLLLVGIPATYGAAGVAYCVGFATTGGMRAAGGFRELLSRLFGAFRLVRTRFLVGSPLAAGGFALLGYLLGRQQFLGVWAGEWSFSGFLLGALVWGFLCGWWAMRGSRPSVTADD